MDAFLSKANLTRYQTRADEDRNVLRVVMLKEEQKMKWNMHKCTGKYVKTSYLETAKASWALKDLL